MIDTNDRRITRATVLALAALVAGALVPSASARILDERPEFVVVVMGDSFSSGEGAPERDGRHDHRGSLLAGGQREFWGLDDPAKPLDNQRCHRSPLAGPAVAARRLQETFPEIRIVFRSFGCSGAKVGIDADGGGVLWPYAGVELSLRPLGAMPPQVVQANQFLAARGTSTIDALVLAVGINDFGFGKIVTRCLTPFVDCSRDGETLTRMREGTAALPGLYAQLDAAIDGLPGPAVLSTRPRQVYISEYPDPTHDDDGSFCDRKPRNDLLSELARDEAAWAYRVALPALNGAVRAAARRHGWSLISGLEDDFAEHGVCADDRWLNANADALRKQGNDGHGGWVETLVPTSTGTLHPNRKGHAAWAERILPLLDLQVRSQFSLGRAAPRLSVASVRAGRGRRPGVVRLAWTDPLAAEQRFELEVDRARTVTLPANRVGYAHAVSGRASYRVRACGASFCSPWSNEAIASTRVPRTPRDLRRDPDRVRGTIRLAWTPADGNHTRFEVRYRRLGIRPRPLTRSVTGSTFVLGGSRGGALPPTHRYAFEVRACSDVGCSGWTRPLEDRVGVD